MDKLSSLIPKVLSKRGLQDEAKASYVAYLSKEWLEGQMPGLAEEISVSSLKDGTLYLETQHSTVLQELSVRSEQLLKHLNAFEGISVQEVRLQRKK